MKSNSTRTLSPQWAGKDANLGDYVIETEEFSTLDDVSALAAANLGGLLNLLNSQIHIACSGPTVARHVLATVKASHPVIGDEKSLAWRERTLPEARKVAKEFMANAKFDFMTFALAYAPKEREEELHPDIELVRAKWDGSDEAKKAAFLKSRGLSKTLVDKSASEVEKALRASLANGAL